MNVQSASNNESWRQLKNLIQAAKVRNAGFALPQQKLNSLAKEQATSKLEGKNNNPTIPQMGSIYKKSEMTKAQSKLGTRFDAYA